MRSMAAVAMIIIYGDADDDEIYWRRPAMT
jgi:hypothetical protein